MSIEKYNDGQQFVILDTETTGLNPVHDRICSLHAKKLILSNTNQNINFREVSSYGFLCDPEISIPEEASKINGYIRHKDYFQNPCHNNLYGLPLFSNYVESLIDFIDNSIIVAHNAEFDLGFIIAEIEKSNLLKPNYLKEITSGVICTKQTFAELLGLPRTFSYVKGTSLDNLCDYLHINKDIRKNGHGSLVDTELTTQCFTKLVAEYPDTIEVMPISDIPEFKNLVQHRLEYSI